VNGVEEPALYLRSLELSEFRAFRTATLDLPAAGVVAVAGANNTGKSALLSALDVVRGNYGIAGSLTRHAAATSPARIRARFELTAEERRRLLEQVEDRLIRRSDALSWLEWHFIQIQGDALLAAELHAAWGGGSVPLMQVQPQGPGATTVSIGPTARVLEGKSAEGLEAEESAVGGSFQSIEEAFSNSAPGLVPAAEFLRAWRARYYHFGPLRPGTDRQFQLRGPGALDPSGANLPGVLHDLLTNDFQRWTRVRQLMEQIVPDVGRLEIRSEGPTVRITFSDPNVPGFEPNLKDLGTGVEQLLMTIVMGVTQSGPSVVVMEEPETNLHAGAQRALLGLLHEWATDRLFVASTHSQVLLDRAPTIGRLFLVRRDHGVSTVTPLTKEPSEALAALGVRLSDVLSADRLLLVEGLPDQEVLDAWFSDLLRDSRVEIIEAPGGDNARFADLLEGWIRAADRLPGRRVLYLRDRDELPKQLLDKLDASEAVHVLRRRELENYLFDPDAIAQVLAARGRSVDAAQVSTALRQAADELKGLVTLKRAAWEQSSIRLVDRTLLRKLAREGPDLTRLQAAIADRLPSDGLRGKLAERWAAVEAEIAASWAERWQDWAPGEEVLGALWQKYLGAGYSKRVDGLAIARAMVTPPNELRTLLTRFLND
jgi:predicted ATPase